MIDVCIIGGGPMGLACGIEAKKAGLSHIILEKGMLVNSLYHFPTNMTFFSTSVLLEIGDVPFISHTEKPTRREALEYYRRVWQSWDLDVRLYEEVFSVDSAGDHFIIQTAQDVYHGRKVVVATGFYDLPVLMGVPGEDLPKVKHYYDDAHPYTGQDVLVVGAANSACQVALETHQRGARVTMAIRSDSIYRGVKYWIKPNIENRIKEGSIQAYFSTRIQRILPDAVILDTPDGQLTLKNDFVLAMTGYQPNYAFMQKLGIDIVKDDYSTPCYDEKTHETNIPGMYLAGVVCGGMKTNRFFIENSRTHAEAIIQHVITS